MLSFFKQHNRFTSILVGIVLYLFVLSLISHLKSQVSGAVLADVVMIAICVSGELALLAVRGKPEHRNASETTGAHTSPKHEAQKSDAQIEIAAIPHTKPPQSAKAVQAGPAFFSKREKAFLLAVLAIYLAHICSAIITKRYYYADGAFSLADLLNNQNWTYPLSNDASVCRIGINVLNQLPVVLCMKLGIKNVAVLSAAFGIPLFFYNLLGLLLCWRKCRNRPDRYRLLLFPLAAYAFFCIPSDIFSINQTFTAFWLYFLLFFNIILGNDSRIDWLLTLILLGCAAFSHESYLIVSPLLLLALGLEVFLGDKKRRIEWAVEGLCILAGFVYQLWYMRTHAALTTGDYYGGLLNLLKDGNLLHTNVLISVVGLAVVILMLWKPFKKLWLWVLLGALGFLYILFVSVNAADGWTGVRK